MYMNEISVTFCESNIVVANFRNYVINQLDDSPAQMYPLLNSVNQQTSSDARTKRSYMNDWVNCGWWLHAALVANNGK